VGVRPTAGSKHRRQQQVASVGCTRKADTTDDGPARPPTQQVGGSDWRIRLTRRRGRVLRARLPREISTMAITDGAVRCLLKFPASFLVQFKISTSIGKSNDRAHGRVNCGE
jgi:hypothetical protein